MANRSSRFIGILALCTAPAVSAYELTTHDQLSRAAVDNSVLVKNPSVLTDIGLNNVTEKILNGNRFSILEVVGAGARLEDELTATRPIHHFFDPTRAADANNGALRLPVPGIPTYSSPTWALADRGPVNGQEYSFRNARSYLLNALTSGTKSEREAAFTRTFQTLGMVIHHLQDMAQPQHVRNDLHCKEAICRPFFHSPSAYEDYTEKRFGGLGSIPTISGYPSVYTGANATTISTPRALWYTGDGKGIAEFTNRNFVSAGTNFRYEGKALPDAFYGYPSPAPTSNSVTIAEAYAARRDGQTIPPQLAEFCGPSTTCMIEFYATSGTDALKGEAVNNPRASSLSIFDWDLKGRPVSLTTGDGSKPFSTERLFSLNSFNFDAAADILLKRAVGYSAGLIDYFFRGKLDFKKDEKDQTKFRIVNLGSEAMSGRFALYYDANDGNRYPVEVDPADANRDPQDAKAWRLTIAALNPNPFKVAIGSCETDLFPPIK
jgi:hypothetical protein